MNESTTSEDTFTMKEYLEVDVKPKRLDLCKDCYTALGWTIVNTCSGIGKITLRLQRNRKIKNRETLLTLQKNCEDAFMAIDQLEESKTTKALAVALGIGIAGTVCMGGAVFAYLSGRIALQVFLAVPGFLGWGVSYFLYHGIKKKSIAKAEPMIAHNYDVIYASCEKAAGLLK